MIFLLCPTLANKNIFKNIRIWKGWTFKTIVLEGQGFRGGSDEKMKRMQLRRDIVVIGLPPLVQGGGESYVNTLGEYIILQRYTNTKKERNYKKEYIEQGRGWYSKSFLPQNSDIFCSLYLCNPTSQTLDITNNKFAFDQIISV